MTEAAVRVANRGDLPAVAHLFEQLAVLHDYTSPGGRHVISLGQRLQRLQGALSNPSCAIFVGECQSTICAAIMVWLRRGPPGGGADDAEDPTAIVTRLIVEPAVRRQGLGSALLTQALDWSRLMGARGTNISVAADNHQALRFYRAHGFQAAFVTLSLTGN
jgi:ribosomal protein S18 acetylase RimI-like enzyme